MGIHYESLSIGSVRAEQLSGRQGIRRVRVMFLPRMEPLAAAGEAIAIFGTRIWVSVAPEGEGRPIPLGSAEPETAWCDETRDGQAFDRHVMYRLILPSPQLLALEEMRHGRSLVFTLDVRGNSYGSHGVRALDDQLQLTANISDWSRVLKECGAADVLLVGVHLPLGGVTHAHAALDLVRRANEHLSFGHYTAAVAECRRAIESLWKGANLADGARDARKRLSNMNGQLSMTKRDRELALGEALRVLCHVAHHVGADAQPEVFGRLDAALAVSTTAALVSSLAADPDLAQTSPVDGSESEVGDSSAAETKTNTRASTKNENGAAALAAQVVKVREHLDTNPNNRPGTLKSKRPVIPHGLRASPSRACVPA